MTVLRDGRTRQLECEQCPATTDTYDADDFQIMVEAAKDAGWTIKLEGSGEYTHTCPDCRGESALDRARRMFG